MKLRHLSAGLALAGAAQACLANNGIELPALTVTAPGYPENSLEIPSDDPPDRRTATVSSFDRRLLDELQADRIEDLAGLIPAAQPGIDQGGLNTSLSLRGFAVTAPYFNGMPDIHRLYVRDLVTVERIDVLSGPEAIMQGISSPGGAIRYVGKQALFETGHEAAVQYGSGGSWRLSADTTGAVSDTLAMRLSVAAQDGETQPGGLSSERWHGLVGLAWRYHPDGLLRVEHEQQNNARPFRFGTVMLDGTILYDHHYTATDKETRRHYRRSALYLDQQLSRPLSLSLAYARADVERKETLLGYWSVLDANTLSGYYTRYQDDYRQQNLRAQLAMDFQGDSSEHQLVIGADHHHHRVDFEGEQALWDFGNNDWAFRLDIHNPDFSTIDTATLASRPRHVYETAKRKGIWIAQRSHFGERVDLHLGARQNQFEIESDRNGNLSLADSQGDTWQGGLALHLSRQWSLYHQQGTGIQPVFGLTLAGEPLPPARARQRETGLRFREGQNWQAELVYFHLEEDTPVSLNDPQNPDAITLNTREVEGWQSRAGMNLGSWTAYAQFTHQDSSNHAQEGRDFVGVARRSGALRLSYGFNDRLKAWWHTAWVGSRFADAANTVEVPGYTRHDLGGSLAYGRLDLSMGVRNLQDTRYVAAVSSPSSLYQGQGRYLWVGLRSGF